MVEEILHLVILRRRFRSCRHGWYGKRESFTLKSYDGFVVAGMDGMVGENPLPGNPTTVS